MKNLNEFIRRVQLPEVKLSDETRAAMVAELERLRDDAGYRERCCFSRFHSDFENLVIWDRTADKHLWRHVTNALEQADLDVIETSAEPDRTAKLEAALKVAQDALIAIREINHVGKPVLIVTSNFARVTLDTIEELLK